LRRNRSAVPRHRRMRSPVEVGSLGESDERAAAPWKLQARRECFELGRAQLDLATRHGGRQRGGNSDWSFITGPLATPLLAVADFWRSATCGVAGFGPCTAADRSAQAAARTGSKLVCGAARAPIVGSAIPAPGFSSNRYARDVSLAGYYWTGILSSLGRITGNASFFGRLSVGSSYATGIATWVDAECRAAGQ
jgi:hypothetical protein